ELERAHPEVAPGEPGVHEEAVEVAALDARVLDRGLHGVDGEGDRIGSVHLALRCQAEAGDRGHTAQRMPGHPGRVLKGPPRAHAVVARGPCHDYHCSGCPRTPPGCGCSTSSAARSPRVASSTASSSWS